MWLDENFGDTATRSQLACKSGTGRPPTAEAFYTGWHAKGEGRGLPAQAPPTFDSYSCDVTRDVTKKYSRPILDKG